MSDSHYLSSLSETAAASESEKSVNIGSWENCSLFILQVDTKTIFMRHFLCCLGPSWAWAWLSEQVRYATIEFAIFNYHDEVKGLRTYIHVTKTVFSSQVSGAIYSLSRVARGCQNWMQNEPGAGRLSMSEISMSKFDAKIV